MKAVVVFVSVLALVASISSVALAEGGLGSKDPGLFNLKGSIYHLPVDTDHMPEGIEKQKPSGVIYTEKLDVAPRSFTEGFPGVTNRFEWFGLIYTGRFQVTKPGKYAFRSISDDGIILWIDGAKVLEHDSIHGPDEAKGEVTLAAGMHDIKVWYFQGPATEIALQLFVTAPKGKEKVFSMKDYAGNLGTALKELGGVATPEGIRVRLAAGVLFDLDKSVLKPAAQKSLKKLATVLEAYPTAAVSINGYTSSEGEDAHNQKLSEARANAVKDALAGLGPKTLQLSAAGHGEANPIANNKTEKTRAPNRRVEILVKP